MDSPSHHPYELNTLVNEATNALIRLDERIANLGAMTTPIANALAALEAARSAALDHVHYAAHPIASALLTNDATRHPVARLTSALIAAHDPDRTRDPITALTQVNTIAAGSPVHAGRLRLHPADPHSVLPTAPHSTEISDQLTALGDCVTGHLRAHPIGTIAWAHTRAHALVPYAHASEQTARAWTTYLLDRASVTFTIPAPLATGLTADTHHQLLIAYANTDHETLTEITAQALLQGTVTAANFADALLAEAAAMRETLTHARMRSNSLTWAAADNLIAHPVTHSAHIGALLDSDRFGGHATIAKLAALGILEPDARDTHHAPRILTLWNTAMTSP
ncbi:hypothetical protein [Gordonia malaquae]|uniref:hypothetical protein n=1 Tax=Gordonia malaquae TaxID=410332 RepID=UPI00301A963B